MGHPDDKAEEQNDNQIGENSLDQQTNEVKGSVSAVDAYVDEKMKVVDADLPKPPLSMAMSTDSTPFPPELARTQAGVITSRPGAMRVPGCQQAEVQDDEESALSPRSSTTSLQVEGMPLVSAELVVPSLNHNDITADVSAVPAQASEIIPVDKADLVHAEPMSEQQIGLREILKNRTVRIALLVCLVFIIFVVTVVAVVVVEVNKHNSNSGHGLGPTQPNYGFTNKNSGHGPPPSYEPTDSPKTPHYGNSPHPSPAPTYAAPS